MDEISKIVGRAIYIANIVKDREPFRFAKAQQFLRDLAEEIKRNWPHHPSLEMLEQYLVDSDAER